MATVLGSVPALRGVKPAFPRDGCDFVEEASESLLVVPAVIAAGGLWFNRQQQDRALEVERQRAQDEALQAYLDQMGQLLLDKDRPLRQSKEGDEVRIVARVRTLTILPQLNGERKGNVMRFLLEAGLIRGDLQGSREEWTNPVITLFAADLRDVDLSTYDWSAMVLTEADLRGANMSVCSLAYAFLTGANL